MDGSQPYMSIEEEERHLLAETKWLVDTLKKLRKMRRDLRREREQLNIEESAIAKKLRLDLEKLQQASSTQTLQNQDAGASTSKSDVNQEIKIKTEDEIKKEMLDETENEIMDEVKKEEKKDEEQNEDSALKMEEDEDSPEIDTEINNALIMEHDEDSDEDEEEYINMYTFMNTKE